MKNCVNASNESTRPLRVMKPAILPDDNAFYWILAIEAIGVLAGLILHKPTVSLVSLVFMGTLPGIPLFFHTIFHFAVKVQIFADKLSVTSYLGNNVIKFASRQEIHFGEITYVYYLEQEIKFLRTFCNHFRGLKNISKENDFTFDGLSQKYKISREEYDEHLRKTKESLPDLESQGVFFLKTKLNLNKYMQVERSYKGGAHAATTRIKACLVLSNSDGTKKVYFANFLDLSRKDARGLLSPLKLRNSNVRFLMDPERVKWLVSTID
ncbi:MAG: hypothetical protein HQK55_13775 [Deltaproteobacteria bacterium]|nr:hypothetical protein [Deltaproteobacteria bacterium]